MKRPKIPPLCGVTEVAEILKIKRTTIPSARKNKSFPDPIIYIGNRPFWLEQEIIDFKDGRSKNKNEESEDLDNA